MSAGMGKKRGQSGTATLPPGTRRRCAAYQEMLDDLFPIGGLCVTFTEDGDRLRPTGVDVATGRLVCTNAKKDGRGRWWYEVLLDPRRTVDEDSNSLVLWVSTLTQHPSIPDLWEGKVHPADERYDRLRVLAEPEAPWRPTQEMRLAVTAVHGREIFQAGGGGG